MLLKHEQNCLAHLTKIRKQWLRVLKWRAKQHSNKCYKHNDECICGVSKEYYWQLHQLEGLLNDMP